MYAIEYANVLSALKKREANYALFAIPDLKLELDSSLYITQDVKNPRKLNVTSWNMAEERMVKRTTNDMVIQLLNQVATEVPMGIARKEFIPNLGGNYIIYNSEINPVTGKPTVTGGIGSVFGYLGDSAVVNSPILLEESTDNGKTYAVDAWFSFPRINIYSLIKTNYPEFFELIEKAGMSDSKAGILNFITEGEKYTIFAPTDQALENFNVDSLTIDEIQQIVKYHFIRGELTFTDGKKETGNYETLRIDELSTKYSNIYSTLEIRPSIDLISIYDNEGNPMYDVIENNEFTNRMAVVNISSENNQENYVTNGVIHSIDKVLIK